MAGNCKIGSRAQVWNGTCEKTAGGLKKTALKKNKNGEIVSKKASASAKKLDNLSFWKVQGAEKKKQGEFSEFLRPKKGSKAYNEFKKNEGKMEDEKKKSSKKKSSKKKSKIKCSSRGKKKCKRASKTCKWSTKKKKCSKR
tara:strand:- start:928 stop:1350 length:423 start_codon:yes stop_codon:yes gene_type:complete